VTVVAIGGDTNLAGLLHSRPGQGSSLRGRALVAAKVQDLVIEDGLFPTGAPRSPTRRLTSPPPSGSKNPMRIVYTKLFNCGPPGDGDWDGPTMLYAVEGASKIFSVLGQGGAAVINTMGGLSWGSGARHPVEVYVHVANQTELNARINALIESP
jgi:hypothetical protein